VIEKEDTLLEYPKVKEQLNLLKETVADDIEQLQSMNDQEVKSRLFFLFRKKSRLFSLLIITMV
jgi:hypothetical protein